MSLATFPALVALIPAMVGPVPLEQGSTAILLAICGGGASVEVALAPDDGSAPMPATTPCCAKGCRAADKRRDTSDDN